MQLRIALIQQALLASTGSLWAMRRQCGLVALGSMMDRTGSKKTLAGETGGHRATLGN